ncbi:unnamed protein product, partial [Acanthoscelides obtectus]
HPEVAYKPLKAYDNLLGENGVLLIDQRNQYHERAVEAKKNFLLTYHKPENNILNQISSERMKQVNENRERLLKCEVSARRAGLKGMMGIYNFKEIVWTRFVAFWKKFLLGKTIRQLKTHIAYFKRYIQYIQIRDRPDVNKRFG